MFLRFCLFVLCLLMTAPVLADEIAPLPVIDPATIFADGVEVIETLPVVNADDEQRTLYSFNPDTQTWNAYPYPDDVERLIDLVYRGRSYWTTVPQLPDGTFMLATILWQVPQDLTPERVRIFNPQTGTFSRPDNTVCGITPVYPQEPWLLIQSPDGTLHLCNLWTGEESPALPDGMDIDILCYPAMGPPYSTVSSTFDWVVMTDCDDSSLRYGYHIATGRFEKLEGVFSAARYIFPNPYDNRLVTIQTDADEIIIYETQEHQVVHRVETDPQHYPGTDERESFVWLDELEFLYSAYSASAPFGNRQTVTAIGWVGQEMGTPVADVSSLSPDGRYILVEPLYQSFKPVEPFVQIYDRKTQTVVTIAHEDGTYDIQPEWHSDNTLTVYMMMEEQHTVVGAWHIQVAGITTSEDN